MSLFVTFSRHDVIIFKIHAQQQIQNSKTKRGIKYANPKVDPNNQNADNEQPPTDPESYVL